MFLLALFGIPISQTFTNTVYNYFFKKILKWYLYIYFIFLQRLNFKKYMLDIFITPIV